MNVGDKVIYKPRYVPTWEDGIESGLCERGVITSLNRSGAFVKFDGDLHPKLCYLENLKLESDMTTASGFLTVNRIYKNGKIVSKESSNEETIDVPQFVPNAAAGMVEFGSRMVLNMGNFETIQISVSCQLPAYVTEVAEAYAAAKAFVDSRLNDEVSEARELRERQRGS